MEVSKVQGIKELWKEGIEEGLRIQIKDEDWGFSEDTSEILNLN